jgi:NAD(P)-dependent dehydrogenase (short-subunit alcohol dehydrogenase family)
LPTGEDRRVCLLTGAGGLLGDEFCRRWASDYQIVAVCRSRAPGVPSQLETYVDPLAPDQDLPENATPVHVVYADLADPADVGRVVELTLARFGRVDLLVNNAAHQGGYPTTMVDGEAALADLEAHLSSNVVAPFRLAVTLAQAYWTHRAAENRAHSRSVVNVSSLAGVRTFPFRGQAGYAASKAALNSLTGHMAAEFAAFGVRVNTVVPNSFPELVSTAAVADAVVSLDRGTATGDALVLDQTASEV